MPSLTLLTEDQNVQEHGGGFWLMVTIWAMVLGSFALFFFEKPNVLWAQPAVVLVEDHSVGTNVTPRDAFYVKYLAFSGPIVEGPTKGRRVEG